MLHFPPAPGPPSCPSQKHPSCTPICLISTYFPHQPLPSLGAKSQLGVPLLSPPKFHVQVPIFGLPYLFKFPIWGACFLYQAVNSHRIVNLFWFPLSLVPAHTRAQYMLAELHYDQWHTAWGKRGSKEGFLWLSGHPIPSPSPWWCPSPEIGGLSLHVLFNYFVITRSQIFQEKWPISVHSAIASWESLNLIAAKVLSQLSRLHGSKGWGESFGQDKLKTSETLLYWPGA